MSGLYESLSGAKGLRTEGKSAKNIAYYNAEVAEQEGKAAEARAGFDQIQQADRAAEIKSSLNAAIGGAGGGASKVKSGIIGKQAEQSELENLLIGFEGETALRQSMSKAVGLRLSGDAAQRAAKNAARRANVSFGLQLGGMFMGGFSKGGTGKQMVRENSLGLESGKGLRPPGWVGN